MQEMGPLVNIVRPGFDELFPLAVAPNVGRSSGCQDSHYLVSGDITSILHDNQVD